MILKDSFSPYSRAPTPYLMPKTEFHLFLTLCHSVFFLSISSLIVLAIQEKSQFAVRTVLLFRIIIIILMITQMFF